MSNYIEREFNWVGKMDLCVCLLLVHLQMPGRKKQDATSVSTPVTAACYKLLTRKSASVLPGLLVAGAAVLLGLGGICGVRL